MQKKKILVLLPDGVGLRNFAFTSFVDLGEKLGWEVIFWNHTPFELSELGYREIRAKGKPSAFTDLLKRTLIMQNLNLFANKFKDPVYQSYIFPSTNNSFKSSLKSLIIRILLQNHKGEPGLEKLRLKLKRSERRSRYYKNCKKILQEYRPDLVLCTNQRPVTAIAPLTAAEDLGIPTSTFIFSWDNLPKATMVIEPDHYLVWSDHMKEELMNYYPYIKKEQIFSTGSPQFEPHYNEQLRRSRKDFYIEHKLDLEKDYICFSGDDITTSPDDPQYLHDVAEAVESLNKQREIKLGILFRRCPVDFSDRYDEVLERFRNLIVPVPPQWQKIGGRWNEILPTKEDLELQVNTILHTKAVINLGSSMVFDYVAFDKPCLFLNYDVQKKKDPSWSHHKVYNFVHFRSMPSKEVVIWLNSKEEIAAKLLYALEGAPTVVETAKEWFHRINCEPPQQASTRIWKALEQIHQRCT